MAEVDRDPRVAAMLLNAYQAEQQQAQEQKQQELKGEKVTPDTALQLLDNLKKSLFPQD